MVASGGTDFWVKGLERSVKQGWFASLTAMAYSSSNDVVAAAGGGGHILLLNLRTLGPVEPRKLESGVCCLCFGKNGQLYAGLENGSVVAISAYGAQISSAKISRKPITSLLFTDTYGLVVASKDRRLRRLNPRTLDELTDAVKFSWTTHDLDSLNRGNQLVASGSDNNLHLVDPDSLSPLLVVHPATTRQTHNASGFGQIATAGEDGTVVVLDEKAHTPTCVVPVASEALAGLQIPAYRPSLFLADSTGVVQEWGIHTLSPETALQVEGKAKAMAISPSGHVLAVCSDRSVQVFIRASQLEELAWHQEETAWRNSFFGRITQLVQRIMRRPLPALPPAPPLPAAVARAALNTDPEVREIERSTSQALVSAYRQVAAAARQVDWKSVGRAVEKHRRQQLEAQRLELRRLREERLSKTLEEAQKRREWREQQHRIREQAIRQARAEERSKQFWNGVSRLVGNIASSAASNAASGTWVNSYTRKDGTRVRGYRRR